MYPYNTQLVDVKTDCLFVDGGASSCTISSVGFCSSSQKREGELDSLNSSIFDNSSI